jgi:glycosyltransferase involved in cell wall biosynthesis
MITVSICMITYNHESYISKAIEGVMMQQTSFLIELIIGEDCSTDNTRRICQEYKAKFPEKIRLLLPLKNLGASANFMATFQACSGKYIALCEGDDYWTDPYKLQKQVDFLEANKDFAICFHKVTYQYEDIPDKIYVSNTGQKEISTIEDLAKGNFISTLSCVFRNNFKDSLPDFLNRCPIGDYPLHLWNAQYGKLKYLDENMATYRVHKHGIWELKPEIEKIKDLIYTLDQLIGNFNEKIDDLLLKNQINLLQNLLKLQEDCTKVTKENFYAPKGLIHLFREQEILIEGIKNSYSYRIGKIIMKPLHDVKRVFKWLKIV